MDFVVPLKDVSVAEKKQAKFECTITKDVSKVMWYKGSDIVTSDQKYDIIDAGKKHMLVINCCQFDDEDDYTVEALDKRSTARLSVEGVRLRFVSPLRDQTVKEGGTALFELELSHEDVPVTWFKNDQKLHPGRTALPQVSGRRHLLELRELTLDDTCQIRAEAKGIPCLATLTVIEGDPYFTVKLQDYTAVERDEVLLECELSKDVEVQWYQDQAQLTASPAVVLRAEGRRRTLMLRRAAAAMGGQYVCDCGTDKTSATLIVQARQVRVVRPMYGAELCDGETARFSVELSEEDVRGQWRLGGELLSPSADVEIVEDGAKHTLVLYNCRVEQTGELQFSAAGASCCANLKVKEPPLAFITPLADVHVFEQDDARFELETSRRPKSFRWLKGGQELTGDERLTLTEDGARHALLLRGARYQDEARYMFEAEDKRTAAKLVIKGIRLEFVRPIKDVTVKERETAEFSVELSHDQVPVVWYRNDVRLHPSKLVHMSSRGRLHTLAFKEVSMDDTSMVRVEAMDKSCEAALTVLEGDLYFTVRLQNFSAVEKDEVTLSCELSRDGGQVRWLKDGEDLDPSQNQNQNQDQNLVLGSEGRRHWLLLTAAAPSHRGQYSCDCSTDRTTAQLLIEERDIRVLRPLYSVEVSETETATFETELSADDLHATWRLRGETLHPGADVDIREDGARHSLTLFHCRTNMAGAVDFSAANAKTSAQLRVKGDRESV
ncbi:obscurin-like protein 1 [Menidia menidia]